MEMIDVDGLRIAYERAGSGQPLVLLHGYVGDGPTTWRLQIEALADEFEVVAWNAPGVGASTDPPESFGMAGYADCLAGFVAQLGLDRAHIAGLSFGGALALEFSRRHPSIPTTLILASAYAGWRGSLLRRHAATAHRRLWGQHAGIPSGRVPGNGPRRGRGSTRRPPRGRRANAIDLRRSGRARATSRCDKPACRNSRLDTGRPARGRACVQHRGPRRVQRIDAGLPPPAQQLSRYQIVRLREPGRRASSLKCRPS